MMASLTRGKVLQMDDYTAINTDASFGWKSISLPIGVSIVVLALSGIAFGLMMRAEVENAYLIFLAPILLALNAWILRRGS